MIPHSNPCTVLPLEHLCFIYWLCCYHHLFFFAWTKLLRKTFFLFLAFASDFRMNMFRFLCLLTAMTVLMVLQHHFAPAIQWLSNSTNLCNWANNTDDELELVAWPLSLESLQNLTRHNSRFKVLSNSQTSKNVGGTYGLPVARSIHKVPQPPKEYP